MNNSEVCIPVSALAAQGEDGATMAPAQGDPVSVQLEGTVSRIEGENVYITPQSANGQPLTGGEMSMEDEDKAMDDDLAKLGDYGGGGLLGILLLLSLLFGSVNVGAAQTDLMEARMRNCSGTGVTNWVGFSGPTQCYYAEINNFTGSTLYLLVYDTNAVIAAGMPPHFPAVAIPTGSTGGKAWGPNGVSMQKGVVIGLSTTPFSFTNASAGGTAAIVHNAKQP